MFTRFEGAQDLLCMKVMTGEDGNQVDGGIFNHCGGVAGGKTKTKPLGGMVCADT